MIIPIDVEPGVARIYHAEAQKRGTTMLELMESVLAFWPAAQWDMQQPDPQPDPQPQPEPHDTPFGGAGY